MGKLKQSIKAAVLFFFPLQFTKARKMCLNGIAKAFPCYVGKHFSFQFLAQATMVLSGAPQICQHMQSIDAKYSRERRQLWCSSQKIFLTCQNALCFKIDRRVVQCCFFCGEKKNLSCRLQVAQKETVIVLRNKLYFHFYFVVRPDHFLASILWEQQFRVCVCWLPVFMFVLCHGVHFSGCHKHCSVVCYHFRYKPWMSTLLKAVGGEYFSHRMRSVTNKLAIYFAFRSLVQIIKTKKYTKAAHSITFVLSRRLASSCRFSCVNTLFLHLLEFG